MFYSREAPDREPLVEKGDHFEEGDPLFIIEVMKMFNKVHAPFAGTLDEALIDTDATIVKRGQPIFKVTPDVEIVPESQAEAVGRTNECTSAFLVFAGYSGEDL